MAGKDKQRDVLVTTSNAVERLATENSPEGAARRFEGFIEEMGKAGESGVKMRRVRLDSEVEDRLTMVGSGALCESGAWLGDAGGDGGGSYSIFFGDDHCSGLRFFEDGDGGLCVRQDRTFFDSTMVLKHSLTIGQESFEPLLELAFGDEPVPVSCGGLVAGGDGGKMVYSNFAYKAKHGDSPPPQLSVRPVVDAVLAEQNEGGLGDGGINVKWGVEPGDLCLQLAKGGKLNLDSPSDSPIMVAFGGFGKDGLVGGDPSLGFFEVRMLDWNSGQVVGQDVLPNTLRLKGYLPSEVVGATKSENFVNALESGSLVEHSPPGSADPSSGGGVVGERSSEEVVRVVDGVSGLWEARVHFGSGGIVVNFHCRSDFGGYCWRGYSLSESDMRMTTAGMIMAARMFGEITMAVYRATGKTPPDMAVTIQPTKEISKLIETGSQKKTEGGR